MTITVGGKVFQATLGEGPAAGRIRAMLPLTLVMAEWDGNEKFARLDRPLPADAAEPGSIRAGDLMLWGDDTLVLFYRGFPTRYRYTRIGRVDDPAGLADAVGPGAATVTFAAD